MTLITNYDEWAAMYPDAAIDLAKLTQDLTEPSGQPKSGTESAAQQQIRMAIARLGGLAWRNNVGATPAKTKHICPRCSFVFEETQQPVRYGLANDSAKMNERIKSADVIGILPRIVTLEDVGATIGQFIAIEAKAPGWEYRGGGREAAQMAFLSLVQRKGGKAQFSTGEVQL